MRVLLIILFCFSTSLSLANEKLLHQVKVGVEDITKEQKDIVWKLMDQYAQAETVLRTCSQSSKIEKRIFTAIEPCVNTNTLNSMKTYFHERLKVYGPQLIKEDCQEPIIKNEIDKMTKAINELVNRARKLCAECIFC